MEKMGKHLKMEVTRMSKTSLGLLCQKWTHKLAAAAAAAAATFYCV